MATMLAMGVARGRWAREMVKAEPCLCPCAMSMFMFIWLVLHMNICAVAGSGSATTCSSSDARPGAMRDHSFAPHASTTAKALVLGVAAA